MVGTHYGGSIVVVGILTQCALLHFVCDLKASKMNIQHSLIQGLMLYEFKVGHNIITATKKICFVKSKGLVEHRTVTRWFKKFHSGCKNLNNQAMSGRYKIMESKTVLQALEANPVSSIWRISGEFGISQSSVVHKILNLGKSILSFQIEHHIAKISQNFWFTLIQRMSLLCLKFVFNRDL